MADTAPGQQEINDGLAHGFSQAEMDDYKSGQYADAVKNGFSVDEVKKYYGDDKPIDTSAYKDFVKKNLDAYKESKKGPDGTQKEAGTYMEALEAGWGMGDTSLFAHPPDYVLPEHANWAMKALSAMGQTAGDLPAMAGGLMWGAGIGAGVGVAIGGPAAPFTGIIGAGIGGIAGMGAAPDAVRSLLMDQYRKGEIKSVSDFTSRLAAASWAGIKGGGVMLATSGVGRFVGPMAEGIAGKTAGQMAQFGSEIGAMGSAGAALQGRLPELDDFTIAAATMAGIHGIATVVPKLMNIYEKTGQKPLEVAKEAGDDVTVKQDLLNEDQNVPEQAANPDTGKIEVPSQAEQEKLGLKPVGPDGKVEGGDEPPSNKSPDLTDDEHAMLGRIGKEQEGESKSMLRRWKDFRINHMDSMEELKNIGATDSYMKGRIFNAVNDRVQSIMDEGVRDAQTGENVEGREGINKILDEQEKTNQDPNNQRFTAYWMARQGLDLDAKGIESLFPTKEHYEAAKRLVEAGEEKYQPFVDRMVKAKNEVLQYVADRGRITQESVDKMVEANPNHLSLHTIQEVDELTGETGGSASILKKRFGSLALKVDPITSTYKDIERLVKVADANMVRQSLLKEAPEYLRKVESGMQKIDIAGQELSKAMGFASDTDATDISLWRPETSRLEANQVEIYTDGKREVYEGDPGVIQALKSLDGNYQAMPVWGKMMSYAAKSLRMGTLMNPVFPLRHYVRSQRAAGLYSQTGMIPFIDPALSIADFFTKPQVYKDWIYDGGAVKSWDRQQDLSTRYGGEEPPWMKRAWNYTKLTATNIAHINESFISGTDNLARYTEYKRAIDQGYTREQAAFLGRNVTADYQRMGAKRSALYSTVPFLRAHIQVTDRAVQELTSPFVVPKGEGDGGGPGGGDDGRLGIDEGRYRDENPTTPGLDPRLGFAAKAFAGITVPAVLMWAASHDDTRMDQRPWWEKALTMGIPIDHWRKPESPLEYTVTPGDLKKEDKDGNQLVNDGPVLKIPVAGEPEMMFGSCVVAALESMSKHDPQAVKECAWRILTSAAIVPIPTAIAAPIEQWAGKNIFTGRNIVSWQKEKELPEDQQDQYTSELAKGIAKTIGYVPYLRDIGPGNRTLQSPMVIDNYLHDWFGGGGQYVSQGLDKALQMAGKTDIKIQPEKSWFEEPFVKDLFDKFPNARPQIIEDFHDKFKEADEAMNSLKDAQKRGDFARMTEIMQKYGANYQELKGTHDFLTDMNKNIQKVMATDWKPTDKRQLLNTMYYQMLSTASVGLETLKNNGKPAGGQ